jgi:hypothetical protein
MDAFDFSQPPRDPVVLSTQRNVPPVVRPNPTPVYALYAGVVLAVSTILGIAAFRTRRRRPPEPVGVPVLAEAPT